MGKLKTLVLYLILAAGLVLCGCDKGKEEALPLDSLEQTLWEGTLTDSDGSVTSISVAFRSENNGYYVLEGNSFWFTYYPGSNKVINISGGTSYDDNILAGEWWIFTMTQQQLILKEHPLEENITETLTLKRVETL